MITKELLKVLLLVFILPVMLVAQLDKVYLDIEEAIKNPDSVYILNLRPKARGQYLEKIPAEIAKFKNLKELYLVGNRLSELPDFIKDLKYLNKLHLDFNSFEEFPTILCEIERLVHLSIGANQIKNLPPSVSKMKNLRFLDIRSNSLGKGDELYFPPNLDTLSLLLNEFRKFPIAVLGLQDLKFLMLGGNEFWEIPKNIVKLKKLRSLYLNDIPFKSLPKNFGKLKNLEFLDLSRFNVSKKIHEFPRSMKRLKRLKSLNLFALELKGLPNWVCHLKNLETIIIGLNEIDTSSSCFRKMKSLKNIDTKDESERIKKSIEILRKWSDALEEKDDEFDEPRNRNQFKIWKEKDKL